MSNKTTKKSVTLEWPKGHFTIADVWQKVGGKAVIPNITLRFRVKQAEDKKEIVLIGKIKPSIGRPKKVFAKATPSKDVLEAARAAGVVFLDDKNEPLTTSVTVAEIKAKNKIKDTSPVTTPVSVAPNPVSDNVQSLVSQ